MGNVSKVMIDVDGSGNNMMVLPLDQIIQSNRQRVPEVTGSFEGSEQLRSQNSQNQSRSAPVRGSGR
jgi:hypothetical protein